MREWLTQITASDLPACHCAEQACMIVDRKIRYRKDWPLPNVHLGVSVESAKFKTRIDHLRNTPAKVRFLSIEPLLEEVGALDLSGIHQVIVGAESGPGARPMREDWVRSVRDQAIAQGVKFFYKQNAASSGKKISLPMLDGRQWTERP
jgi:protein gp37